MGRCNMTKTRKKKNLKLKRRIKRTVASIIMIMAVTVAAIPVENLDRAQAATREDWTYTEPNPSANTSFSAFKENDYSEEYITQMLEGDRLTDSVNVKANGTSTPADAIIVGYAGTENRVDISENGKMYHDYAKVSRTDIEEWVKRFQNNGNEKYAVQYPKKGQITISFSDNDGNKHTLQLPSQYDVSSPLLTQNTSFTDTLITNFKTFSNKKDYFEYKYIKEEFTEFQDYEDKLVAYNSEIDGFNDRSKYVATLEEWNTLEDDVNTFINNNQYDGRFEIFIDADVRFEEHPNFYLKTFCKRSSYTISKGTSVDVPLEEFELEQKTYKDIYVYVAKYSGNEEPDNSIEKYIDENGYLSDGYVNIVGVGANAFDRNKNASTSTVTEIKLPNTIIGIADSAFENSGLNKIEFYPDVCIEIGARAFYRCGIAEINLTNDNLGGISLVEKIGNDAFYGTRLGNISFPSSLKEVGKGCFAETPLASVDFSKVTGDLTIGEHAFYNCTGLSEIDFPASGTSNQKIKIRKAAFAVPANAGNDALAEFVFPNNITEAKDLEDYILAGRANLEHVTFPSFMLGAIPENTLAGCSNLELVTLGKLSEKDKDGQGIKIYTNEAQNTLFEDILNTSFCVEGPGFTTDGKNKTECRKQTLNCKAAVGTVDEFYVPYKFIEAGIEKMEKKQESETDDDFTAIIDELKDDMTARLSSFEFETTPSQGSTVTIEVPSDVGGYAIKSLGEGCFEKVIPFMGELVINDGTISTIDAGAIKDATVLEKVTIGNSVTSIGADAFSGCTALEEVHFNEPVGINEGDWVSAMEPIGDGAFKTNSNSLVFYGVIHDGYAPFEYAMSEANAGFTAGIAGKNICYRSNEPDSLAVIRDNVTGLSTLVDYPNMLKVSDNVKKAFGCYNNPDETPTEEQIAFINGVLNINVSDGIDSIDVKKYFSEENNSKNKDYVDKIDIYTSDDEAKGIIGGLFSGEIEDNNGLGLAMQVIASTIAENAEDIVELNAGNIDRKQGDYTEYVTKGNDHLTSIILGDNVEGIPEKYAFDSCENLISVTLGANVSDLGVMPFKGCKSLTDISSNAFYNCENGILYKATADGVFSTIAECLEARGNINGILNNSVIDVAGDPSLANVTDICEEAFSDCLSISEINFTGTGITGIPKNCFKGDKNLRKIVLPESVSFVEEGAFVDLSNGASDLTKVVIEIHEANCYINSNAIDDTTTYLVYGYEYADSKKTKKSAVYNFCQAHDNVEFKAIEPGYTVIFRNYDGKIIDEIKGISDPTQRIVPPDMEEYLKTNPYEGHVFSDWIWTDSSGTDHYGAEAYSNVSEDRDVYALYKRASGDYVFDGKEVTVNIVEGTLTGNGTVNAEKTSITIESGRDIYIKANKVADKTFRYWSVSDGLEEWFNNEHDSETTFTVPNAPESGTITITANFIDTPGSGTGGNTGSGTGGNTGDGTGGNTGGGTGGTTDSTTKYKLTVNYGSGSGEYKAGETVAISAFAPESASKVFSKWTTNNSGVGFASPTSSNTTLIMPASDVTVTANYKVRVDDDDDDDESSDSRRPGTGSSTNVVSRPNGSSNVGNNGNSSGNSSGNNNVTNDKNGNKIHITKNGISNKDVASIAVSGSTDNFIVRITESEEATAAVKTALRNKYGSLDGLSYFPMDISLYDSTGQTKITDTYGLNITVTMPIPDVLIQYGGNARVAAADDGYLQEITPKFTTIDGIACISFVPPHFSPYVIYVDTNNLVAGQTFDSTPATGDPIHPKWFIAIGMACISVIMFATSDGRKRKNIKMA